MIKLKYAKNNSIPGSEKVMVTLVNSKNPGMEILPTHRLIKEKDISIKDLSFKKVDSIFYFKDKINFIGSYDKKRLNFLKSLISAASRSLSNPIVNLPYGCFL